MYYFDNTATTCTDSRALQALIEYSAERYYNPSSLTIHSHSVCKEIDNARAKVAALIGARVNEIYFTSGGTESDNTVIFGIASQRPKGNIVASIGEHSAVYASLMQLKNSGYDIRIAPILPTGGINAPEMLAQIDAKTVLVVAMHVNNETGAINDIGTIFTHVKQLCPTALCFSDGVQAAGKIKVDIHTLNADFYAISGHKLHAPKGIAALFVRKGVMLRPLIFGGGQESGMRSGTENVGAIIAFGIAAELAGQHLEQNAVAFTTYKSIVCDGLSAANISFKQICLGFASPAILTLAIDGAKAQVIQNILEEQEIIIGLGSACSSHQKQNRVQVALGLPKKLVDGIIRISFSRFNTQAEVEYLTVKLIAAARFFQTKSKAKSVK